MIDPVVLSSITAAVSQLGSEFAKGVANEAGKSTWASIKKLFGWETDPLVAEIPEKVARALTVSPHTSEKVLQFLKHSEIGEASSLVGKLEVSGGKVVIADSIQNLIM
jgi:hypothetical protein